MKQQNGFTLIELMVAVAIMGLMMMIAIPSMNEWQAEMRIDNEISMLHRTILTTRNTAINLEQPVTMCPLVNNTCTNDWTKEVTVFVDLDNDGKLETGVSIDLDNDGTMETLNETIIRVKDPIRSGDNLVFARDKVVYQPTGQASASNATFNYCAAQYPDKNRGIVISLRGRAYVTSDYDGDGLDETRTGSDITCS